MTPIRSFAAFAAVLGSLLAVLAPAAVVRADRDEEHESRSESEHGSERGAAATLPAQAFRSAAPAGLTASDGEARYREECGSCHLAYPPGLLPAASWREMMTGLDRHFGQNAELDPAAAAALAGWLTANAAEAGTHPLSRKVLRSLGGQTPLRVSEVPFIRREHGEVRPSVWSRPAVGSVANCGACHTGAERGDFSEERIVIPK